MTSSVPPPVAAWVSSLPGPYVGERWATFLSPIGIPIERKVEAWGQIATPDSKPDLIAFEMYNNLPFHGNGWTYISWRIQPYEKVSFPLKGKVTGEDRKILNKKLEFLRSY